VLQADLGLNTLGFGNQFSLGYRMADDFTIYGPAGWQVNEVTFFAYQSNSTTTPTINGVYFQIWDGPPDNPGSNIVFGDLVTNRLVSTDWTGIYRVADYDMPDDTRPVMANVASAGVFLPPGTYWLDWMTDGSLTSGPWATPISVLGETTTGNAMQYTTSWNPALDTGTTTQQGMPFLIKGCEEEILWNQPVSQADPSWFVSNQLMPDSLDYSAFIADDFFVEVPWSIETIFIPGGWGQDTNLANASDMIFLICEDDGGIPTGAIVWELVLPVTDPHITLYLGSLGSPTDTLLSLPMPLVLPPGHYWLIAFPVMDLSPYGQYGRPQSDTINGYTAQWINPNGGFGLGTGWQDWTVTGVIKHDAAFRLSGEFKIYMPLITK